MKSESFKFIPDVKPPIEPIKEWLNENIPSLLDEKDLIEVMAKHIQLKIESNEKKILWNHLRLTIDGGILIEQESTRQRVEREAMERMKRIYNGRGVIAKLMDVLTDQDVYGQTHTK